MPDDQIAGKSAIPLPVGDELGQLARSPVTGPITTGATSPPAAGSPLPSADPQLVATFIADTHAYITQYIQAADQKGIFIFSASAALLAFLYQDGASAHWLKSVSQWSLISAVTCVGTTALAGAAALAVAAIVPRLPGEGVDLVSFNGISRHATADAYSAAVLAASPDALLAAKSKHSHILAGVCRDKYQLLRAAVWFEAIGVVATVLYFVFGAAPPRGGA